MIILYNIDLGEANGEWRRFSWKSNRNEKALGWRFAIDLRPSHGLVIAQGFKA